MKKKNLYKFPPDEKCSFLTNHNNQQQQEEATTLKAA